MGIIKSKSDYINVIENDRENYDGGATRLHKIKYDIDKCCIHQYLKYLRSAEYYMNCKGNSFIGKIRYLYCERKKNKLGCMLGFSIPDNVLGLNTIIYHPNVVINPNSKIGNNCKFHGNNCIGNKGTAGSGTPQIGDYVEFGFGAVAVGDIQIADNVVIGANAVVTKSIHQKGAVVVGNPAKIIK